MIFNPLESGLHLWYIIKRKSVHIVESLARLAYNKGTALFRGNDPLRRSAAGTFLLIVSTSAHNQLMCWTWPTQEWRQNCGEYIPTTQMDTLGLFHRSIFWIMKQRRWTVSALNLTTVGEHCSRVKLRNKLKCDVSSRKIRPWAKRVWWGGETGHFKCSVIQQTISAHSLFGHQHMKPSRSETTQNVVHKGPVCRQQADLKHQILSAANSRPPNVMVLSILDTQSHYLVRNYSKVAQNCI